MSNGLEDECLVYSATAAMESGQRGRTCTRDSSAPNRVCCYYTTRWIPRRALTPSGAWGTRKHEPWRRVPRREFGGPEGSCTLSAVCQHPSRRQRGALLIELRVRKWLRGWESHPRSRANEARLNFILPAMKLPAFARGSFGVAAVALLGSSAKLAWRAVARATRMAKAGGVGG